MLVNIRTQSDADFVRGLTLTQAVPAWDAATFYAADDLVGHLNKVWQALADNSAIEPGSDGDTWTLAAAPPLDLTGSTLLFAARAPVSSNYAPLSLSSAGSGIVISDAEAGAFTLTLPQAVLAKMPPGQYAHSLIRLRPDGLRELVWHGVLTHEIGPAR